MYSLTFRINLLHDGNTLQNPSEALILSNTKTYYVPVGVQGLPIIRGRHGDTFTLYGAKAAYLKKLINQGIVGNIEVYQEPQEEEVSTELTLLGFTDDGDRPYFSFYPIYVSDEKTAIGGFIESLLDDPTESSVNSACMTVTDNGNLYGVASGDDGFEFFEFELTTGNKTIIETPEMESVITTSYIHDGLNDMYDNGNVLNTNLKRAITYTHTQQIGEFEEIADGTIEDGTDWFGSGSTYFTNLYEGLFVLVAKSININRFNISGELGADGSGNNAIGETTITVGGQVFTIFYKKVWGSGDPAVNHIIIVPGNYLSATHAGDEENTNYDTHSVSGIAGADRLAYLLFSGSGEVTEEEFIDIATEFLTITTPSMSNLNTVLSNLNSNFGDITALITGVNVFSDAPSDTMEIGGINDIRSFCAIDDNRFCMIANDVFYTFSADGELLVERSAAIYDFAAYLVYDNDTLYGTGFGNYVSVYDPDTGEGTNNDDKKFQSITWATEDHGTIESIGPVCKIGDAIYARTYADKEYLITLNFSNWTAEVVSQVSFNDIECLVGANAPVEENKTIGFSSEEYYDEFNAYFWHDDDEENDDYLFIGVRASYFFDDPTTSNIICQWTPEEGFDEENVESNTWENTSVVDVVFDEENNYFNIKVVRPIEESLDFYFRIKYTNTDKWLYAQED